MKGVGASLTSTPFIGNGFEIEIQILSKDIHEPFSISPWPSVEKGERARFLEHTSSRRGLKVMEITEKKGWSPYLAGSFAGLLSILSVWIAGKYLGASTTFVRSAGMLEKMIGPERVATMSYFIKEVPGIDWQWMFVVGILIGSLFASATSGTFLWRGVPDMWEKRFGPGKFKRGIAAFSGGVIAMFGARLADG